MVFFLVAFSYLVRILTLLLVVYALLSWFPGARESWLGQALEEFLEPLLKPLRRLPLQIAGLDFTIIVAIFILQMLARLLPILLF
ncbi:YggT family protein [Streptococcus tangpeifui]|uniref:YggT family protein n=1 Tax=Streptococcus tangpeifui TaxID=2709400 RepID=UPI0013EBD9DF|nr:MULTISPECIES: YggT family protein [unclassified Streptococcus]